MGFLSNLFGGKTSEVEQSATEDGRTAEASPQAAPVATVLCPVSGTVMDISEVNDPVFAGKAMGDGIAIVPSEGVLVAPISGTVEALFPTGHALAIKDEAGMGVMLHIGIDTVQMQGQGFTALKKVNDRVRRGEPIIRFDRKRLSAYDLTVMMFVTQPQALRWQKHLENSRVEAGDRVMTGERL